ncbi:heavy-metal-associated domain-containing protein [Candidatus Foliamicus sp.]
MSEMAMKVTGMSCSGCSSTVQGLIAGLAGVSGAEVDLATGATTVTHDGSVAEETVYGAIRDAGFGVSTCGNETCVCANCHCNPCQCAKGAGASANAACKCTNCQCDPCVCN